MSIVEALLISIGLAMDAFAVSVCKGLSMKKMNFQKAIIIALWFGIFQGIMPLIGYILGSKFEYFITSIDHWVALILLGIIGGKMIIESFDKEKDNLNDDTSIKTMFTLAIATSIDALAIGIAYVCGYGSKNALTTFTMIGIITFILSVIGVKIGNKFGNKLGKKSELMGGIILIGIGIKILLEHLSIF